MSTLSQNEANSQLGAHAGMSHLPWLFSARVDLLAFAGSFLLAMGLLALGQPLGLLERDTPDWLWVGAILMIDVAHVYATGFRVYFDGRELRRRPWLYGLTPCVGLVASLALYQLGSEWFWRALAYLAVFHFVRQQYGWMALYRSREQDHEPWGGWIDSVAIYSATLYPLIYWHSHPRNFSWFVAGDFVTLSPQICASAAVVYWAAMLAYVVRSVRRAVIWQQWILAKTCCC